MCGLFGWLAPAIHAPSADLAARLTDLLAHRGPDAGAVATIDTGDGWQLALGHRRLAIIDLSDAGRQPFEAFGLTLVFNGEIYNYLELRQELIAQGYAFRTDTDTEVLAAAWRHWGAACLPRLRGMFAVAVWDARDRSLSLARDPFGKKPLYLSAMPGGGIAFASEIQPLTDLPGFDRRIDPDSLSEYLRARYVPGPHTFFAAITKLEPGTIARWHGGTLAHHRYIELPLYETSVEKRPFEENVARFSAAFDDAVAIRMRSDAPYGAFLSGGLDSAAIIATMARHSNRAIRTFSVGFEEVAFSELPHAQAVAARFGCEHHALVVRHEAIRDDLPEAILRRGAPVSEPSDLAIMALAKTAYQSVRMVLTGEGSDELLGGYPKHRAARAAALYRGAVPAGLHRRLIRPLADRLPYAARRARTVLDALGQPDGDTYLTAWLGMADADVTADLLGHAPPPFRNRRPFRLPGGSPLRDMLYFDQTSWLPDNLLERGDRMMMAGSIEGRMPFLDIRLARVIASFPDDHLTGAKGGKRVLRAAMAGVLGDETLARPKVGFRVPVEQWFRGSLAGHLSELLLGDEARTRPLLRESAVRRLLTDHAQGHRNHEKAIWTLLSLEQFLRLYRPVI